MPDQIKTHQTQGTAKLYGHAFRKWCHRFAVEWEENGDTKSGVFIPRRDTSLALNAIVGGRIFPGRHHLTKFNVHEKEGAYHIDFKNSDGTSMALDAIEPKSFPENSIFETLAQPSEFFEHGDLGYPPNKNKFEGLRIKTYHWSLEPLDVNYVHSSFFENHKIFPPGSVRFDNALLMTNIEHEWNTEKDKYPEL